MLQEYKHPCVPVTVINTDWTQGGEMPCSTQVTWKQTPQSNAAYWLICSRASVLPQGQNPSLTVSWALLYQLAIRKRVQQSHRRTNLVEAILQVEFLLARCAKGVTTRLTRTISDAAVGHYHTGQHQVSSLIKARIRSEFYDSPILLCSFAALTFSFRST